jgi:hypothetical protein
MFLNPRIRQLLSGLVLLIAPAVIWWFFRLPGLQAFLFGLTLVWLAYRLILMLDLIIEFLINNALLAIIITLFYTLLIGQTASSYGIMYLFWHEDLATRLFAAFFSTLFFAMIFIAVFYADPGKNRTRDRMRGYLSDRRNLIQIYNDTKIIIINMVYSVEQWFCERGWRRPTVLASGGTGPAGAAPTPSTIQDDLERFLKVFFWPFWWLLLLPALAPWVYAYVPRNVPTRLVYYSIPWFPGSENNITANPGAWLVGLLIWGSGILAGLFAIWAFVEVNRRLFGTLTPESRNDPTLRSGFDGIWHWICPLPEEAWETPAPVAGGPTAEGHAENGEFRRRVQLQQAIIRFVGSVFAVYAFGIIFNMLLSTDWFEGSGGPSLVTPEERIAWGAWVGIVIFGVSLLLTGLFLRRHVWELRQEIQGMVTGGKRMGQWRAHTVGLAVGLALAGLQSAVFYVFLGLTVVALIEIIIRRFSETWNWPLKSLPLRVLLLLVTILWLWFANSSPSKLRFPGLETFYNGRKSIQSTLGPVSITPLKDDRAVLETWERLERPSLVVNNTKRKPKLAVLAVSGGANRAAFWTAEVLEKLHATLPDFSSQLRLITGASGGMVGAAYYVAALYETLKTNTHVESKVGWLLNRIPRDSLTPVLRQWMLGDAPLSLLPADLPRAWDRGLTLERTWPELKIPFKDLAPSELKGQLPSLVFSPMLVEDGRQLLISNLPLQFLTRASGNMLSDSASDTKGVYSFTATEFFKLFPEQSLRFELATAVRINASFPYVSPALYLPTDPYRRVVDAGYYDNYGIAVAAAWTYHHREWLKEHTSGVVLIQVRAYPKQVGRLELKDPPSSFFDGLARAFQFVTSPVEGGAKSRNAATLFRNDQVLDALDKWFQDNVPSDPEFFTTVLFESALDVAMTWYTTEQELALVKIGFGEDPGEASRILEGIFLTDDRFNIYSNNIETNLTNLQELQRWWKSRPAPTPYMRSR